MELGSNSTLTVDGHSCNLDGGAYWILVVPSSKSEMIRLDFENFGQFQCLSDFVVLLTSAFWLLKKEDKVYSAEHYP